MEGRNKNQEITKIQQEMLAAPLKQSESMMQPGAYQAAAALRSIMDMYNKVNYNTIRVGGMAIKSVSIDTRFVSNQENPFIQFDIENTDDNNHNIIFGGVLAIAGAAPFYGQPQSACDTPLVIDQRGPGIRAVQAFGSMVCHTPVIVSNIQLISDDATQRNQPWKYQDIAYDQTITPVVQNTTATFTRFDTDKDIVKLSGVWPLGPQTYLSINAIAKKRMTVVLFLSGTASPRDMRMMNG